jgi:hypothetical protein
MGKETATEFRKIIDHSGIVWNAGRGSWRILAWRGPMQARNSRGAMPILRGVGRLRHDRDFLSLWKDVDADIAV